MPTKAAHRYNEQCSDIFGTQRIVLRPLVISVISFF